MKGCCGPYVHGAVGLAKAGLQAAGVSIDAAAELMVFERRQKCISCEEAKGSGTMARCAACHNGRVPCFIAAKTRIASESCPRGKWLAITEPAA